MCQEILLSEITPCRYEWYCFSSCDVRVILLQLNFTITGEQMQVWIEDWVIPIGRYIVYVGGQQPDQITSVPSNIMSGTFDVTAA